jgi:hypothetical protein
MENPTVNMLRAPDVLELTVEAVRALQRIQSCLDNDMQCYQHVAACENSLMELIKLTGIEVKINPEYAFRQKKL